MSAFTFTCEPPTFKPSVHVQYSPTEPGQRNPKDAGLQFTSLRRICFDGNDKSRDTSRRPGFCCSSVIAKACYQPMLNGEPYRVTMPVVDSVSTVTFT